MPPDTPSSADLAAALAARVLHDMAGEASGLVAAFDLLADPKSAAFKADALQLAETSARNLARQIALRRLVFVGGEPLSGSSLEAAARAVFGDARGSLAIAIPDGPPDPLAVRVLLALIDIARGSVGAVTAEIVDGATGVRVTVRASGPRARLREEDLRGLAGDEPAPGPLHRWVFARWVKDMVEAEGGDLRAAVRQDGFEIEASLGHPRT